ncbi:unnamed protein product, partial [Ilex paraguariensis]
MKFWAKWMEGPDGNAIHWWSCAHSLEFWIDLGQNRIRVDRLDGAHCLVASGSDAYCSVADSLVE